MSRVLRGQNLRTLRDSNARFAQGPRPRQRHSDFLTYGLLIELRRKLRGVADVLTAKSQDDVAD